MDGALYVIGLPHCGAGDGAERGLPYRFFGKELKMAENENVQTEQVETQEEQKPAAEKPVNPLLRSIELRIAQADALAATETALKSYAKDARMPGFRKGHVPMKQIRAMYGARAFEDAVNELLNKAWANAVREGKLQVAALETISPKEGGDETTMLFEATYEAVPEVTMPAFEELELKRYTCTVGDEEVEKTIEVMRRQRADYQVREDRPAQKDDRVKVNFKGTKDGEAFEGGTAEGYVFELGQGRMLPEFEEAVTGMKMGEKKTFPLTFPEDYHAENLKGQTVEFEVEVLEVCEAVLPEIDDEFAQRLGVEAGVEAMRADIRKNLENEVKARLEAANKGRVMQAVYDRLTFAIPQAFVKEEERALAQQAVRDLAARGLDTSKMDVNNLPTGLFTEQAERRVRLALFMQALIAQEDIQAADEDVRALAESVATSYENPEGVVAHIMGNQQYLSNLRAQVVENKATNWIFEHAKTSEEAVEFDKLMAGNF